MQNCEVWKTIKLKNIFEYNGMMTELLRYLYTYYNADTRTFVYLAYFFTS